MLTPLSVDPAHPFPYISDLSLNLAAIVRDPFTRVRRFARVKVPPLLPRFISMPDGERFVPIEVVIAANLGELFPGMEIATYHVFRVTRDADVDTDEDEGEDLLAAVESGVRRRRRGASPVRLEVNDSISDEVRELLLREIDLEPQDVYASSHLLDLGGLWSFYELRPARPEARTLGSDHAAATRRRAPRSGHLSCSSFWGRTGPTPVRFIRDVRRSLR